MKLPLDAKIKIASNFVDDYLKAIKTGKVPQELTYKINSSKENSLVKQAARSAVFNEMAPSVFYKKAMDTRRVDQQNFRHPRKALQYWHRSDQFIDEGDDKKIKTFTRLAKVLQTLKDKFGTSPEWFDSYSRQLYDNVYRILRVKEADLDIFRPQLAYLEQLIFARYRISMEELSKISNEDLSKKILSKDEDLIGRSNYLKETQGEEDSKKIIKDSNGASNQESIINAIFGSGAGNIRKDGERTVERTITITIRDNVID